MLPSTHSTQLFSIVVELSSLSYICCDSLFIAHLSISCFIGLYPQNEEKTAFLESADSSGCCCCQRWLTTDRYQSISLNFSLSISLSLSLSLNISLSLSISPLLFLSISPLLFLSPFLSLSLSLPSFLPLLLSFPPPLSPLVPHSLPPPPMSFPLSATSIITDVLPCCSLRLSTMLLTLLIVT